MASTATFFKSQYESWLVKIVRRWFNESKLPIFPSAITAFFLTILKLFEARTKECEAKLESSKNLDD